MVRLYFNTEYQRILAEKVARLMYEKLNGLPDKVIIPGRGGWYWVEGFEESLKRIAQESNTDMPFLLPFIASVYEREGHTGSFKQGGLREVIQSILQSGSNGRIVILDDVVDRGLTTWQTALQIYAYFAQQGGEVELYIFSPYKKPFFENNKPQLINIVYSLMDTDMWIVFPHELDGFPLSHFYSVIKLKRGLAEEILLGEALPSREKLGDGAEFRLNAGFCLGRIIGESFKEDLPALIMSYMPFIEGRCRFGPATLGATINETLRAWPQIALLRDYIHRVADIPPSAPEVKVAFDAITENGDDYRMMGGGDYKALVGRRPVVVVAETLPPGLTKGIVSGLTGIPEEQIYFASTYSTGDFSL